MAAQEQEEWQHESSQDGRTAVWSGQDGFDATREDVGNISWSVLDSSIRSDRAYGINSQTYRERMATVHVLVEAYIQDGTFLPAERSIVRRISFLFAAKEELDTMPASHSPRLLHAISYGCDVQVGARGQGLETNERMGAGTIRPDRVDFHIG